MTKRLGRDYLTDLSLPDMVDWPIFPFKGDLSVRTVRPFNDEERPRAGEPGADACPCESDDGRWPVVWSNDRWEVRPIHFDNDGGAPVPAYMLQTVDHMDIEDFDDDYAAELGIMTIRMERAIKAIGSIGRVHFNRWGDGGSHFHVWFLGRPFGASQLSGFTLPLWGFVLPSLSTEVRAANDEVVRAALEAASSTT